MLRVRGVRVVVFRVGCMVRWMLAVLLVTTCGSVAEIPVYRKREKRLENR